MKKTKPDADPLVAAELKKIREPWERIVSSNTNVVSELVTIRYSDIVPKKIKWLWENKIPKAAVTIFVGDPGVRKSFCTLHIAAAVSQGRCFPNCGKPTEQGTVFIMSSEDSQDSTILPRLMAADANLKKIEHIVTTRETTLTGKKRTEEEGKYINNLLGIMDVLEKKIEKIPDFKLLIIDTLSSYLGEKRLNAMEDMRCFLDRLSESCHKHNYAVIVVNHFNKNEEGSAQYRGAGSVGIRGAARAQWGFVLDPQDKERTLMLADKVSNTSTNNMTGLAFHIREVEVIIEGKPEWEGCCDFEDGVIHDDLDIFLSRMRKKQSPRKQEAADWLKDYLKDGKPHKSNSVIDAAKECGITETTLRRAMPDAKVKAEFVIDPITKKIDHWEWHLNR